LGGRGNYIEGIKADGFGNLGNHQRNSTTFYNWYNHLPLDPFTFLHITISTSTYLQCLPLPDLEDNILSDPLAIARPEPLEARKESFTAGTGSKPVILKES
jgi:hypothetical protein